MLRSVLLLATLASVLVVRRRGAAQRAEQDLWAEAGVAPDLRRLPPTGATPGA